MDKNTLFEYGWAIIIVIILIILFSLSLPYSEYIFNANNQLGESLSDTANTIFTNDNFYGDDHLNINYTTNYTIDEINSNQYMYGIGKTKSEYVIATFNEDYSEVIITKNGEGSDGLMMDWRSYQSDSYEGTYSPMYEYKDTLETVVILENVTSLGSKAFFGCFKLKEISLPETLETIGSQCFYNTLKLESIYIPSNVTSIGSGIFLNSALTTIYGATGSYAETWANSNGYTFITI